MALKAARVTQLRLMALNPVHINKAQQTRESGSSNALRSLEVEVRNPMIILLVANGRGQMKQVDILSSQNCRYPHARSNKHKWMACCKAHGSTVLPHCVHNVSILTYPLCCIASLDEQHPRNQCKLLLCHIQEKAVHLLVTK